LYKKDLDLNVTPVIFNYKKRELLVSSSKECRLFMLDTSQLGGNDHRTPLDRTPLICNENVNYSDEGVWGSMASWEDSKKTRWILTPFWGPQHPAYKYPVSHGPVVNGAIAAFKVEDRAGQPKLSPAWVSLDMDQPEPPVIANGLVFAYANGEDSRQFTPELGLAAIETAVRIKGSTHAVLYVLDAQTGRKLYSSADQINSFVHFGSLAVANGRVYIGTWDGALYCFGIEAKR
jgi:hypothetical protein